MNKINVAVVDDHRIVRDGIISLFKGNDEITITGDFESGDGLLEALKTQQYDLILLDMHMPGKGGIETATMVVANYPHAKILMHTMSEIVDEIEQVVKIGAHGYILKTAGQDELAVAIKMVANGSSYFSSTVMNSFIKSVMGKNENVINGLSHGQIQIMKMYCEEKQVWEIAAKLNMTDKQVTDAIDKIKVILDVKSDIGLAKFYAANSKELSAYL